MNIALGKPYTMSSKPVYPGCTDDGDTTDLTDGRVHRGEDALWGQKGTVGWVTREPVHVTIDLGQIEPIMGASVHTGAGEASVAWPCSIAVEVSDDGNAFYLVGDLVRLDENPPPRAYQGYTAHTYRTRKLRTHGRYIRFELLPPSQYIFMDEIEVYRGDKSFLEIIHGGSPVRAEQLLDESRLTRIGCYRRIRADLEAVNALVNQRRPVNTDQVSAKLDRIRAELEASRFPADTRFFRAIVPYNQLHRQIFEAYSELLPKQDESGFSIWHTPRYQMLSLFETPASPISELNIRMMQNERRAEVVNITNTSREEKRISFRIADLPGGANPAYIKPHQVEFVDTREGEVVATALVPLHQNKGSFHSTVASGMTRQIWLSFDRPEIPAGDHRGHVIIACGPHRKQIGLRLSVIPVRCPDQLQCSLGMWDYLASGVDILRYGTTTKNRPAAIRDMREHRVDVVWGEWKSIPQIKISSGVGKPSWDFDEQGNLTTEIDFSGWDEFVGMWPDAKYYLLSHPFSPTGTFAGKEQGAETFNRAVSQFASRWAEHNRQIGLKPGQAGICFFDEPSDEATFRTTYLFARAFKTGTDEILLFTDPGFAEGTQDLADIEYAREALDHCDIFCPNLSRYMLAGKRIQSYFQQAQAEGRPFWFYQCHGPTRVFNPSYYRLQSWYARKHGATGVAFWAYADGGKNPNSWNEYPAVGAAGFTPVYFSADDVTTTKHWEALLEGRQDYQYVSILRDRVDELRRSGLAAESLQEAERLADELADTVIDHVERQFGRWYASGLRDNPSAIAEEARLKMLDMLDVLLKIA